MLAACQLWGAASCSLTRAENHVLVGAQSLSDQVTKTRSNEIGTYHKFPAPPERVQGFNIQMSMRPNVSVLIDITGLLLTAVVGPRSLED